MSLPVRSLPGRQELILSATPYIGKELWTDGVKMLHQAMLQHFDAGKPYGDYKLAQYLDVHRAVADVWLLALQSMGCIERKLVLISQSIKDCACAPAFVIDDVKRFPVSLTVPRALKDYDPWEDRTLDSEIPDVLFADYYIDKFYDVQVDEHYILERRSRKRPTGTFTPLDYSELPRHATDKTFKEATGKPAPIEWRKIIDKAAL